MADVEFGLTGDREAAAPLAPFLSSLPRTVSRSGAFLRLNGERRIALDPGDRRLREKWHRGHAFPDSVVWPGAVEIQIATGVEQAAAGTGRRRRRPGVGPRPWEDEVVAWYERDFEVPRRWVVAYGSTEVQRYGRCSI